MVGDLRDSSCLVTLKAQKYFLSQCLSSSKRLGPQHVPIVEFLENFFVFMVHASFISFLRGFLMEKDSARNKNDVRSKSLFLFWQISFSKLNLARWITFSCKASHSGAWSWSLREAHRVESLSLVAEDKLNGFRRRPPSIGVQKSVRRRFVITWEARLRIW